MSKAREEIVLRATNDFDGAEQVAVLRAHAAIGNAHSVVKALTGIRGRVAAFSVVLLLATIGTLIVMSPQRVLLLPAFVIIATAVLALLILSFVRLTAAEASLYAMFEDVMRLEEERHRRHEYRDAHE